MNAAATEPLVGVINAGSSSVKFSFYDGERRILSGQVDGIGAHPSASATGSDGEKLDPPGSRYETAESAQRGPADDIALGQRPTRPQAPRCARPPCRSRGNALFP